MALKITIRLSWLWGLCSCASPSPNSIFTGASEPWDPWTEWDANPEALFVTGDVTAPCKSPVYCHGEFLRYAQLGGCFPNSKDFVDSPVVAPLGGFLFTHLGRDYERFQGCEPLRSYFADPNDELQPLDSSEYNVTVNASIVPSIKDETLAAFTTEVMKIWPTLLRQSIRNRTLINSSLLPIRRPFVVPGGRFRELYYWDSFFILEGLLRTRDPFITIARNHIENFLDFIEKIGFVPNGSRLYYLNRSQPPLLTMMVQVYLNMTGEYTLLKRALPLLETEYDWWMTNRSVTVFSNGRNYTLNQNIVRNTEPRPESYTADLTTAGISLNINSTISDEPYMNRSQTQKLFRNIAAAVESGMDFSARFLANVEDAFDPAVLKNKSTLQSVDTKNIVPVDLNSILYYNEKSMAELHGRVNSTGSRVNGSGADIWKRRAESRRAAIADIFWNKTLHSYFDYNLTSNEQILYTVRRNGSFEFDAENREQHWKAPPGKQVWFSPTQFYPFWTGAASAELLTPTSIKKAYTRIFLRRNTTAAGNNNNGIPDSTDDGEALSAYDWTQKLALNLTQTYVDHVYCSWRATGGVLEARNQVKVRLPDSDKDGVPNLDYNGTIFEKYSESSLEIMGVGGEYALETGFGWTNGVLIWAADMFKGLELGDHRCDLSPAHLSSPTVQRRA